MTVMSVEKDLENLAVVLVAEFSAPVEKVWGLWTDPRKLERWWGPPDYPATFEQHDLSAGSDVAYYMTSPTGDKYRGWWQITSVTPPSEITFVDGFADAEGNPNPALPTTNVTVTFTEQSGLTRMVMQSKYGSMEHLNQAVEMGMLQGIRLAADQMDALLAE